MDDLSVARAPRPYTLHRDGDGLPVSTHPDFTSGWRAGQRALHDDPDHGFALYSGGRLRATFARVRPHEDLAEHDLAALALGAT